MSRTRHLKKERLQFLSELKRQEFFVGMNCIPLLPNIIDTDESLNALIRSAKTINLDYVLTGSLTLIESEPAEK